MNNNIISATPQSGSGILPSAFGANIIQTQQPTFNANSFIQLMPTQINSPLIAANMNISGELGSTTSNVVPTGDNRNSTLTFMPQMAFISSGVGPTPLPANIGDLGALQQTTSSASPVISVITSTNNTTSNQHNTSFLISSGVPNNSILSAPVGVTPINVILASNGSTSTVATSNMGNAAATTGGKHSLTPLIEMKSNSVIPTSVLICNRPQYQLHGSNNKPTPGTPTRTNVCPQPTPMSTMFNPELVKQIVVGNAPNSVITHASARNTLAASKTTQTLLKSPSILAPTIPGMKQPNISKKSTTLLPQTQVVSTIAATTTTTSSTNTTQEPKKQAPPTNILLQANTTTATTTTSKGAIVLQQAPINSKIPLSEAAKAAAIASSTTTQSSIRNESNTDDLNMSGNSDIPPIERDESMPPPQVTTSTIESSSSSVQANVSVIKATSILNQNNNPSKAKTVETPNSQQNKPISVDCSGGSLTADIELLTKPMYAQAKLIEKQESLLKSRPAQNIIECNTSPRSKRSKSLNCALKEIHHQTTAPIMAKTKPTTLLSSEQHTLAERRHSTASEGKLLKQKSSPPRRKQSLVSKASSEIIKEYEIIDLIDYNEEERNIIEKQLKKLDLTDLENKSTNQNDDDANKISNQKDLMDMKPPQTTKKLHEAAMKSSNENIEEENELIEGSSIKIEIVMEEAEEAPELKPQQTPAETIAENEDIIFHDTKAEDTQISVEHTQDSIEKSLYCDEKISISSTSTSSSRQSLHDDILLAPPSSSILSHSQSQNMSSRSNQPSTSAAAGLTVKTPNAKSSTVDSLWCALNMLSNFNMLTWNQRIGSARGTNMRFQLNEFNLIEINERCSPRTRIHTAYEKPIYERESVPNLSEKNNGLLYLCRRCNCHGPALDFLAPEFCSLDCLKRDSRKRRHEEYLTVTRKRKTQEPTPPTQIACKKSFRWSTYLPEKFNAIAAPVNLFINPFPTGPNKFQIGMKLEAIDPENCSLFCVCTIVDIQGYRLKLTFDGYEYMYDFWVNADSMDIFPPGWCAKTKRVLQPPKGKTAEDFSWSAYLNECKAIAAQRVLFTHLNVSLGTHNPFKIGMHLEAEDLNDTGKLCVASVADVLDNRIRVHFDGWDDCYDYWVDISSPYIHPCGWHVGRHQLIVPPEYENSTFLWTDYINNHGSGMAATEEMFSTRDPIDFKPNMKLEVVDPRNPSLIRPATVVGRKGHRVKLHLDCWASNYCFWLEDDSADLHPIGWCEATGHDLEPPPGYKMRIAKIVCSTFGCRGIGNAKRLYLNTHTTRDCCPYSAENWRQKGEKPPRLEHDEIVRVVVGAKRDQEQKKSVQWKQPQQQQQHQQQQHLNEAQILQQIQLLDNIKTRHVIQQEKQQQKQTTDQRTHGNDIANTASQQKTLIKSESADKPITSTVKAYQPAGNTKITNIEESTSLLLPQIKIAKEFLYDYGPRLQQNYNIWQRNCAFDMQRIKRNPLLWSTKDTCAFVQCVLRNSDITERFLREDIDGNALLLLQQSDLTEMLKLKLGPAVKLYSCILQLRTLTAVKFDVKPRNASKNN